VQALVAIPFVVRIVAPTLRAIDARQREAAAMLGASPGRVRREIDVPIVSRALAVAAGFAFAISLGEFGATVFLARPDRPTLPVAIFRFLGRPGELNAAQAYALAVVLMVVTTVSVLLVERIRVRRGGWL
jgi:thiamine transport system permease protein